MSQNTGETEDELEIGNKPSRSTAIKGIQPRHRKEEEEEGKKLNKRFLGCCCWHSIAT